MKTLVLLALVIGAATASACDSLEGAWELEYAVYKDANGKVLEELKGDFGKSLKVLSKRHFSFITHGKDGKFAVAGAGTYSLKGGDYTEVVTYTSLDRLMGKTYPFHCEMRDGIWVHTGKEDHLQIEEHWRRAK